MAVPLLISKKKGQKILSNDYKLGWLFKNEDKAYWMVWGSSKDKETALQCAKDVIEKQGKRDIFISDSPLTEYLTIEQISALKQIIVL
jgi:hypothetical protein